MTRCDNRKWKALFSRFQSSLTSDDPRTLWNIVGWDDVKGQFNGF